MAFGYKALVLCATLVAVTSGGIIGEKTMIQDSSEKLTIICDFIQNTCDLQFIFAHLSSKLDSRKGLRDFQFYYIWKKVLFTF